MRTVRRMVLGVGLAALVPGWSCSGDSDSDDHEDNGGSSGTATGGAGTGGSPTGGRGGSAGSAGAQGGAGGTVGATGGAGAVGGESGDAGESGSAGEGGSAGSAGEAGSGNSAGVIGAGGTGGGGCTPLTVKTDVSPSTAIVMFDRSGSMLEEASPPSPLTRWDHASLALQTFFGDPLSAGFALGLRFFPHDQPTAGCASPACNAAACRDLLVPVGRLTTSAAPLDVHEAALVSAVMASPPTTVGPTGGSPTSAAVRGMLDAALAHAAANPTERTIAVLVTDGPANGCVEDFDQISPMAASALTSFVRTYVIALGAADTNLDELAAAGGTIRSLTVSDSANMSRDLVTALHTVRSTPVGCDLPLPVGTSEAPVDLDRVSVVVTSGGSRTVIPRVGSANECGTVSAWHYDTPTAPRRIVLCPAACDFLDSGAALEVITGCATRN